MGPVTPSVGPAERGPESRGAAVLNHSVASACFDSAPACASAQHERISSKRIVFARLRARSPAVGSAGATRASPRQVRSRIARLLLRCLSYAQRLRPAGGTRPGWLPRRDSLADPGRRGCPDERCSSGPSERSQETACRPIPRTRSRFTRSPEELFRRRFRNSRGSRPEDDGESAAVRDADRVIIFDTTLRDGEQSPGASMNLGQKLQVARALSELGVDVIEAGFAAASPETSRRSRGRPRDRGPIVASLARCTKGDIDASWEALQHAPRRRCHVFLATSPIHRDFKLKLAKDEIIRARSTA